MKALLIFTVILFGLTFKLKCQTEVVVRRDCLSLVAPDIDTLTNLNGKVFRFEFDTLYFINRILIRDYLDIIEKYNELYVTTGDLIDYMENFNKNLRVEFNSLTDNIDKSNQIIRDSLNVNNLRLDKWKDENSRLISINNQLSIDLTKVKEQVRSEKWNSFGKKMLYGGGGMVVGVGLSALIVLVSR